MNERILELAKQADLIQWDTLPSGARTPDHESVVKAKKFAELIVQDVLKIMQDRKEDYDNPGTYMNERWYIQQEAKSDALDDMMDDIRSYFRNE